jgi:sugar phosphate isomerase/epimerase
MFPSFNARAMGLSLSAEATIDLAARAGFAGVDLLVRDLVESGASPKTLRGRMDDLGLRGGAWPLPMGWRGDEATFRRDLERLPRLAAVAATLGLTRTGTWVMPESPTGVDRAEVIDLHVRRLGAIARVLADHGTRLGLEVLGVESLRAGLGAPLVARLADLDPVLGAVWDEAPNLGIVLDTWHLYAAGEPVEAALAWGVDRVAWVHAADLPAGASPDRSLMRDDRRGLPGEHGAIDVLGALRTLADLGYDGPVTAEPLGHCRRLEGRDPETAAREVAGALCSVWPPTSPSPSGVNGSGPPRRPAWPPSPA